MSIFLAVYLLVGFLAATFCFWWLLKEIDTLPSLALFFLVVCFWPALSILLAWGAWVSMMILVFNKGAKK